MTSFALVALASVSFDGLSKTFFYLGLNGLNPLEYPGRTALMDINAIGLLATCAALAAATTTRVSTPVDPADEGPEASEGIPSRGASLQLSNALRVSGSTATGFCR